MKFTIILASVRNERQTDKLAKYIYNKLNAFAEVHLLDLQKEALPPYGYPHSKSGLVNEIHNLLHDSDGFIFVSPEYHQTYSAVLKNMTEYYWLEFNKKPIAVAATSAGKLGGVQASIHMQSLVLALGSYPIPKRLLIPEIHTAFNANLEPVHTETKENINGFLEDFIDFSTALYNHKVKYSPAILN